MDFEPVLVGILVRGEKANKNVRTLHMYIASLLPHTNIYLHIHHKLIPSLSHTHTHTHTPLTCCPLPSPTWKNRYDPLGVELGCSTGSVMGYTRERIKHAWAHDAGTPPEISVALPAHSKFSELR